MKRAVMLGGSGFIGRWLGRALLDAGWEVLALDRRAPAEPGFRFEEADARDHQAVAARVRPGDVFVHLFHSSVPAESMADPAAEKTENVVPYGRLLEDLADAGADLVVYCSSGGQVYGHAERVPLAETDPCKPVSAYGAAKLAMEQSTRLASARRGLQHLIVRPGNPYGPFQELTNRHGVVPALFKAARSGAPFTLYGGGVTVRDYIYIEDAARAILELIRSGARDRTVNVGSGRGVTVSELARLAEAVSGKRINLMEAPIRPSDVLTNALDVSALSELTGFTPTVTLEAGLVRTWEHLSKP